VNPAAKNDGGQIFVDCELNGARGQPAPTREGHGFSLAKTFLNLRLWVGAYVNRCTKVVTGFETPEQMRRCSVEEVSGIRKHLSARRELLADFVRENPFDLSPEELHDVAQFRGCHRHGRRPSCCRSLRLANCSLDTTKPPVGYGSGLTIGCIWIR
jgi:hypothetical protein